MDGRRAKFGRPLGLGVKLFFSYLLVLVVAIGTALLTAGTVSPTFFSDSMRNMVPGGMQAMMGGPASAMQALDSAVAQAFRTSLLQGLVVAGAVALVVAIAVSAFVSSRIVRPVRRLARASRRLASGHYAERVPSGQGDELGELALSFNEMAAELEQTERRRLELIGDVAHELRTPVATLQGNLEGLLDGVVEASPRTWAKLHDEAGRLRRLEAIQPADIGKAAIERLGAQFAEKGLTLESDVSSSLSAVTADHDRAVQVLTNLLTNALRYTPAPGRVRLSARPGSDGVDFRVSDSGVGIAADELPRLFERFYRVDKSRSRAAGGSGVGLTIARALAEAMGGTLSAESAGPGKGATFTFTLPPVRRSTP